MILVQNNPMRATHYVELGARLIQHTPCGTEWTAKGMDRSLLTRGLTYLKH
jgi:hypothetical protein